MLKRYPSLLANLLVGLQDLGSALYADSINNKPGSLAPDDALAVESLIRQAVVLSKDLDLDAAAALASRLSRIKRTDYTAEEMYRSLQELQSRIEDQLSSKSFLFVAPTRIGYYQSTNLFGQEVNDAFPAAAGDIEDAGKCLALGLGTSCVMHLMRVMEVGLKQLAKGLKIPYAPSWESYLRQIQTKIDAKHKTKGVRWKKDEKHFRDISGDLLTIKQAWRNPTMHIDRRYSVEEAEEIFKAVRSLMKRLAIK